ncbi:MAG TPA: hypothetical protein VFV98_15055 [Vicinamibacterales bacterium]|nr:hypothetical protein [Vicinamibacterales bacterium]
MSPNSADTLAVADNPAATVASTVASSQIAGLLFGLTVRVVGLTLIAAALILTSATLLGAR